MKISGRYKIQVIKVYTPTNIANDQQIEQFYEGINTARKYENIHSEITMEDFNSKLGDTHIDNIPNNSKFRLCASNQG